MASNNRIATSRLSATSVSLLILVSCVFLIDGVSISFDFVNWDDPMHVLLNPLVIDPNSHSFKEHLLTSDFGYPIPLTIWSYRLNHLMSGLQPWSYHLTNVVLHTCIVCMVFLCGLRFGLKHKAALVAAAFFALHPITVECVAWVTGRKDLLAAVFGLGSLLSFIQGRTSTKSSWISGSWILLLCSLLSKPSFVLLPVFFAYLDIFKFKRRIRSFAPMFASMLIPCVLVTAISVSQQQDVGAIESTASIGQRLEAIAHAGHIHLGNMLLPFQLLPKYIIDLDDAKLPFPWLGLALTILVLVLLLSLSFHSKSRGSLVGIGAFWIILTYAPVSGLIPLTRQAADTYMYLPCIGLSFMVVAAIHAGMESDRLNSRFVLAACVVTFLVFIPLRWSTESMWKSGKTLWGEAMLVYPTSKNVCRLYGNAQTFGRSGERGKEAIIEAIQVYSSCVQTLGVPEYFAGNRGVMNFRLGNLDKSELHFQTALKHNPADQRALTYLKRIQEIKIKQSQ